MNSPRSDARAESSENLPPTLGAVPVIVLTIISAGIFLYVWALMWTNYIRKANPASRVPTLSWGNVIPGALFYLNLPSLLLAMRADDATEIARLHIAMVLWGSIALVMLIATFASIVIANRQIGMPTRHKP